MGTPGSASGSSNEQICPIRCRISINASCAVLAWKLTMWLDESYNALQDFCDGFHRHNTCCAGSSSPQDCTDTINQFSIFTDTILHVFEKHFNCIIAIPWTKLMHIHIPILSRFLFLIKWSILGLAEDKGKEISCARTCSVFNGCLTVMAQFFLTTTFAEVWKKVEPNENLWLLFTLGIQADLHQWHLPSGVTLMGFGWSPKWFGRDEFQPLTILQ